MDQVFTDPEFIFDLMHMIVVRLDFLLLDMDNNSITLLVN